jgi:class 3 adenylate cyclase/tetratricopeptide (TPR) repeat protein
LICASCGTENAAGRRFCDECGTPLAAACPNCGESNRPDAKFCGSCGAPLDATAPGSAPVTAARAAERRYVTILFVDLVGFTPFAEERDAESVRSTLDRYFAIARTAVERHGGVIEKFIGDAVMAVWGTPTAHEDDAERAVRAAIELLDNVHELGPGIEARAGVVSGEAAVNPDADGQAMVAGDVVNTASRLQSVAPAGTVLADERTMRSAASAIAFEPYGEQQLKGRREPVGAHRAIRVVAQRRGQNRAEVLEAPFVGRVEELRLLKELVHATARDRRIRLVSITGPPGIGKSRLTWELEKYVDGLVETVYWHRGRSPAYGEGITFWALGEMVRRRAGLAESDDEMRTRERITATVAEFVADEGDRQWVEPALLALLGLEPSPPGGRDVLFAAWRIFFERVATRGTTVLLFEDIQWADSGLLDFIDHLLEWTRSSPILVVTQARPEFVERRPDWGVGHRLMTALPLQPLAEEHMRELLGGIVPGLPEPAVATILRRADGIPLYAVETVRMLIADGRLELVGGTYRPTGDVSDLAVPDTLRSLIASRLDALEPADRSLLQDGSVLGQRFTLQALVAIAGLAPGELESRLRGLVRRELLTMEADPRSPERGQYGFVQSLIREVAYGTLARRERRTRHLSAARYFEALGDEELAGALATHYLAAFESSDEGAEAGAVASQARIALRAAADRAAALGAHDQAISYIEQALSVTSEPADRAGLLEAAATSARAAGGQQMAERYAREAIAIHAERGNDDGVGRASALLGHVLINSGDLGAAIDVMQAALAPDRERSDAVSAALLATLSRAYMRNNQEALAIEMADRALAIAERRNLDEIVAEALVNKAAALVDSGRRRESGALYDVAIRLAQEGGWPDIELRGRNNVALTLIEDQPRRALNTVMTGLELARRLGQRSMATWLVGTVAFYAYFIGDDWDEVDELVAEQLADESDGLDRLRLLIINAHIKIARGEQPAELEAAVGGESTVTSDPQVQAGYDLITAEAALRDGRLRDAYDSALRVARYGPLGAIGLPIAIRASLWDGDAQSARERLRLLEALPTGGATVEAARELAAAGIAALAGDTDAARRFGAAIEAFRRIGLRWETARAILDAVRLLPADEVTRGWAAEARGTFEALRAQPYLALLDEAAAKPGATDPLRSADIGVG